MQAVEDGAFVDLSLTIAFRIIESGELLGDLVSKIEVGYFLASKVCPVVGDNSVGKSEATRDILPKNLTIC